MESRARGPWGPLAPDVKVRGERLPHDGRLVPQSVPVLLNDCQGSMYTLLPGPNMCVHLRCHIGRQMHEQGVAGGGEGGVGRPVHTRLGRPE